MILNIPTGPDYSHNWIIFLKPSSRFELYKICTQDTNRYWSYLNRCT